MIDRYKFENSPVRFLEPKDVKVYDSDGEEIEVPKCEKCGLFKNFLCGKNRSVWICMNLCIEEKESN